MEVLSVKRRFGIIGVNKNLDRAIEKALELLQQIFQF